MAFFEVGLPRGTGLRLDPVTGMLSGVPALSDVAGNDGSGRQPLLLEIHVHDGELFFRIWQLVNRK